MRTSVCNIVILLFAFLLPSQCFADSDAELTTRLVGNWGEIRFVGDEVHEHDITLRQDGTFEVKGVQRYLVQKTHVRFVWRGKWGVKQGTFWYVTTYSDRHDLFPLNERLEDKILSVSESEWVMLEESTGQKSTARRVKR